jgi:hypothetical protein
MGKYGKRRENEGNELIAGLKDVKKEIGGF